MSVDPPVEAPKPPPRSGARSVVLVNTGDGKGKSTAAFGTALRALSRGWQVAVVQFIKSGEWRAGEEDRLTHLGADWWAMGDGFSWESEDLDASAQLTRDAWERSAELIRAGEHQVVILDEITYPMVWGWIDTDEVVDALRTRPPDVNVICTGRDAPEALIDVADTVTEMRSIKHAYDQGIPARRGFDF